MLTGLASRIMRLSTWTAMFLITAAWLFGPKRDHYDMAYAGTKQETDGRHCRVSHDSWTHLVARRAVRPLLGTWVRPNHLTTLRLLTGLAACAGIAEGTRTSAWWGGALWLVSAFLDRADGELAREGKMMSAAGHRYDFRVDVLVNSLFFVAAGVGLRASWLGSWAIPLGLISGIALWGSSWLCELLEQRSLPGTKAYSGRGGFDPDDALYLMGPLAWAGWLGPVLVGTSIGATIVMVMTGLRLWRSG